MTKAMVLAVAILLAACGGKEKGLELHHPAPSPFLAEVDDEGEGEWKS